MLAQVPALAPLVRQRLGGQTHLLVHEAAEEQDEDALKGHGGKLGRGGRNQLKSALSLSLQLLSSCLIHILKRPISSSVSTSFGAQDPF